MAKTTQQKIAELLGVSQPFISQVFNGHKKISWPLAVKLAYYFPQKTVYEWKHATPEHIKQAFSEREMEKSRAVA